MLGLRAICYSRSPTTCSGCYVSSPPTVGFMELYAPDVAGPHLGEPHGAVRSCRDRERMCAGGDALRELGDLAPGRDPPNAVGFRLAEPHVAIGTGCDLIGRAG